MTRRWRSAATLAALALAPALAACGQGADPVVTQGWMRLPANPAAPAAAYFTLKGGRKAKTLVGVSTALADKAEMHETMTMNAGAMHAGGGAMIGMAPLARVPLPAGGEVVFAPGGRHVMVFGVKREARAGGTAVMTFHFADRTQAVARLRVVGPAEPAPY
jgi:hypothetical protein